MTSPAPFAGSDLSVLAAVIDGKPWTASSIRNPHFRNSCRLLNKTFRFSNPLADLIQPASQRLFAAVAQRSDLLSSLHPLSRQCVPALVRIATYSFEWVREPEAWPGTPGKGAEEQWHDLLRHLFTKWPVPRFFDSAWLIPGNVIHVERDWYCHVGCGNSWRKADGLPPSISSSAIHHAMQAEDHLTIRQALRRGQLQALGAPQDLIDEVLASRMVRDLSNDAIWSRLFAKLIVAPRFDPREFGIISDLLLDLLDHGAWKRAGLLVGEPLAALRRHCFRRWHVLLNSVESDGIRFRDHDLRRPGLRAELLHLSRASWEPMEGIASFEAAHSEDNDEISLWTIRERCSHAQLMIESRELRHCVVTYRKRCLSGRSAIFSLRQQSAAGDRTRITIEVEKASRRVVQARGKWNRDPEQFEYQLMSRWAAQNELQLAL